MTLTRQKKEQIVTELTQTLSDAESIVFVNFHGLSVDETNDLRHTLRKEEVGYSVARKTLVRRVFDSLTFTGTLPDLDGELAIAWGKETAPAREIYAFQKRHEGKIQILGGVFEGSFLDKEGMCAIAQIPSLDVLRGMFVNIINSPIQRCVIAFAEIAKARA